jgi:hypothetical protein
VKSNTPWANRSGRNWRRVGLLHKLLGVLDGLEASLDLFKDRLHQCGEQVDRLDALLPARVREQFRVHHFVKTQVLILSLLISRRERGAGALRQSPPEERTLLLRRLQRTTAKITSATTIAPVTTTDSR